MPQMINDKKLASLQEQCQHLKFEVRQAMDDAELGQLQRHYVGRYNVDNIDGNDATCLVARNGKGLEGSISVKRVAYKGGDEISYAGQSNYVNKIEFLATITEDSGKLAAALAAKAMLHVGGTRLFLAEVDNEESAELFERLNFSRICKVNGKTRYGYLLTDQAWNPPIRQPVLQRDRDYYLEQLPTKERHYHAHLEEQSGFDVTGLLREQWTTYQRYGNNFFITATFSRLPETNQAAFKIDLFNLADGGHVGYSDVIISHESNYAVQDNAVTSFPSIVPSCAAGMLKAFPELRIDLANTIRTGWPHREGVWVQLNYRRAGVGQTLERIAGDVCKLAFPEVNTLGIIFPLHNLKAYDFHHQSGARSVSDPLYCLAYHLDHKNRPLIAIRYGL